MQYPSDNRQTFQFHGILKKNVKPVHQMLHSVGLDALATANDMNRNVLCTSNPYESQLHAEAYEWAKKISEQSAAAHPCVCGDLARSGEGRDHR
ncbi:sulfite reductase subunit beta [Salmonella enterica subsp. enterica]|uniref:Sulfite reductase subunit beta n=1 Tax=Salmonella enterica I TaxID=59201 RepID=A0A379W3X2_SALET|nr:sulfite reductase subunit beta [Salmonella enterica subsp. enterica]